MGKVPAFARPHTWPGRDIGVRAPDAGETALSYDEVQTGVACEFFDGWPMPQRVCPAGSWERSNAGLSHANQSR